MSDRIYISGPMTGYPQFNFPAFEQASKMLRAVGFDVVSPHEAGKGELGKTWADYLRQDLAAMLDGCTAVATLSGWEQSRGAQLEVHVATALGMRVEQLEWWMTGGDNWTPSGDA